jgi:hypothetical protein
MNKVWKVVIKYVATGVDKQGHDFTGETRSWFTEIDHKIKGVAVDKGREVFRKSAEFKNCLRITSVRAFFVREY